MKKLYKLGAWGVGGSDFVCCSAIIWLGNHLAVEGRARCIGYCDSLLLHICCLSDCHTLPDSANGRVTDSKILMQ